MAHTEPSPLNRLTPKDEHVVQVVAPNPTVGWLPAGHDKQALPPTLYVPTHTSHDVCSALGSWPTLQRMHMLPSELYRPTGQDSHPSRAAFGCWPGEQVSQDDMTPSSGWTEL